MSMTKALLITFVKERVFEKNLILPIYFLELLFFEIDKRIHSQFIMTYDVKREVSLERCDMLGHPIFLKKICRLQQH